MSGILRDRARRLEIGGAQRKKVRRSRTSTVAEGTIPARQRREAQLQKWTFEIPLIVPIIAVTANE